MTRALFVFLALGALVTAAAVAGIILTRDLFYVTDSYRYRLTLNFEQDGRPLVASGVVQETIHQPPCMLIETNCSHIAVKGDAIPISFANGTLAFALLQFNGVVISDAIPNAPPNGSRKDFVGKKFWVSEAMLPTLATFTDLNDPYSIHLVALGKVEQIAGQNTHFMRATVEITEDPVSWPVSDLVPWLSSLRNKLDRYSEKGALKNMPDYFFGYSLMENLVSYLRRNDL